MDDQNTNSRLSLGQWLGGKNRRQPPVTVLSTILLLVCVMSSAFMDALIHPLRFGEDGVLMGLISLPVAGAILFLLMQKNPFWPYREDWQSFQSGSSKPIFSRGAFYFNRIFYFFIICAFCTSLALALNQWLDQSTPTQQIFTVITKNITYDKHGTPSYHAQFQSPIDSPIPSIDFGGHEDVRINSREYNQILPGYTKITLSVYAGFFHLPWRGMTYALSQ